MSKRASLINFGKMSLGIFSGLGNGAYYTFSLISLVFGVYFLPLTGALAIAVPAVLASTCAIFFSTKYMRDERRRQIAESKIEKQYQNNVEEARRLGIKNIPGQKPEPIPLMLQKVTPPDQVKKLSKFKRLKQALIDQAQVVIAGGQAAFNSAKNSSKSMISILALAGLSLTSVFTTNPLLFVVMTAVTLVFGAGVYTDYHLKKTREQKLKKIEGYNLEIEKAISKKKQFKYYKPNPEKNKKKDTTRYYQYSTKEKWKMRSRYLLRIFTGFINGGYFGFLTTNMIFGVYFAPLTGGLSIAVPVVLSAIFTAGYAALNIFDEYKKQKKYDEALNSFTKNEMKLAKLQEKYPDIELPADKKATVTSEAKTDNPKTLKDKALGYLNKFWESVKMSGNRGKEFGRSFKNSTRLMVAIAGAAGISIGIIAHCGVLALGLITFFAFGMGAAAFAEYHLKSNLVKKTEDLDQKSQITKRKIRYIKEKVAEREFLAKKAAKEKLPSPRRIEPRKKIENKHFLSELELRQKAKRENRTAKQTPKDFMRLFEPKPAKFKNLADTNSPPIISCKFEEPIIDTPTPPPIMSC